MTDLKARDDDLKDHAVECRYCRRPMLPVAQGWHCPGCHSSAGDPKHAPR
jgi:Zn finger protein HypA/HybF involved in hydrogenase expression